MLNSVSVKNLTVFAEANFEFSPQLNVIVGENGVGKSHLLKLPYATLAASAEEGRKPNAGATTKAGVQSKLSDKLVARVAGPSGNIWKEQPATTRTSQQSNPRS